MFSSIARRAASSTIRVGQSAGGSSVASSVRTRLSTDITGLDVHPAPLSALQKTYDTTLNLLKTLPEDSVYRQATLAVTQQRLSILNRITSEQAKQGKGPDGEEAVVAFEKEIDQGLAEEVLGQAQHELNLAGKMLEWKA